MNKIITREDKIKTLESVIEKERKNLDYLFRQALTVATRVKIDETEIIIQACQLLLRKIIKGEVK
jgi:hypothetical protein